MSTTRATSPADSALSSPLRRSDTFPFGALSSMMMSSLVPMARACALFFVQRTEAEALANATSSRGVIRSFRTDLNLALCGEEAREKQPIGLKMRPGVGIQQSVFRE